MPRIPKAKLSPTEAMRQTIQKRRDGCARYLAQLELLDSAVEQDPWVKNQMAHLRKEVAKYDAALKRLDLQKDP